MGSKPYKSKPKAKRQQKAARSPRITPGELNRRRKIQDLETQVNVLKMMVEINASKVRDVFLVMGIDEEE